MLWIWDFRAQQYVSTLLVDAPEADDPQSVYLELALGETDAQRIRPALPVQTPVPASVTITVNDDANVAEAPCADDGTAPPLCQHAAEAPAVLFVPATEVEASPSSLRVALAGANNDSAWKIDRSWSTYSANSFIGAGMKLAGSTTGHRLEFGACGAGTACNADHRCDSECLPRECKPSECGDIAHCADTLHCGACPAGHVGRANQCACVPKTCADVGWQCGSGDDGCGGTFTCACSSGQQCGSNHTCSTPCDSCNDLGWECGSGRNACGDLLNCGGCPSGRTCEDNQCVNTSPPCHCRTGQTCCEPGPDSYCVTPPQECR
jgi:hypothetical protein